MGKGARLRLERAGRLSLVFCDLDFDRASRPFARGTPAVPSDGWAVGRAGLVYAEWDGNRWQITGDELIEGGHPASRLVTALGRNQRLIIGHGLLTSDLRAVAMVTTVPDSVLRRSVDTLALAHRLRGGRLSTGCGLSDLAWENLGVRRRKPHIPDMLAGGPDPDLRVGRGDHDPREDAALLASLWQTIVTSGVLAWGSGLTAGGSKGSVPLTAEHIEELTGKRSQPENEGWRSRLRAEGTNHETGEGRSRVQRLIAADLPSPTMIRDLAERLQHTGLIPARRLSDEELYTACQWMGYGQNLDVRSRIAEGRPLTKALRQRVAQALWESTHPEWINTLFNMRSLARTSALAFVKFQQLMQEQSRIRAHLAAAIHTL
ncbi:hypothetical protein ACOZ38_28605 [Sphaerisporangium viridialbum]|uniref:hypothetical protein n=1 Tax=Sphaerisporangium viridialbum TaxID=46189 RepID=UPI003C72A743